MKLDLPTICGTIWLAYALCACPKPIDRVVIRPAESCLSKPPPLPTQVIYVGPPACSDIFIACLTAKSADALESNLTASKAWENEAWLRCGPLDGGR